MIQNELKALRAKYEPPRPISTTIPVPALSKEGSDDRGQAKIEIPHALLPILDVMRHHISELTRDNQAMRYTFGLGLQSEHGSGIASSSKMTLDFPAIIAEEQGSSSRRAGVDLQAVVERVKTLIKENEELGEMVLEVGRVDTEEWERALEGGS
jgi:hypothetical protein